ncbi:chaperone NapD [Magnetospirillum sp. UT-4]|uniref:chaperone NapD n=1 Tax=Magnetospirillum sp. UT-4 TaxID=2681467 RepID=UPI00137C9B71|nr:chaperone NapD [Magnetospirillum sp. UT-4]CAA7625540.1 Periplasmic nitrate reductase accessory protein [Magnetospirillum sp. UT-4]
MRVNAFIAREHAEPPVRPVNICGVLVHARPEKLDQVKPEILALPGCEIHAGAEDGRLVVVVEDAEGELASTTINRINDIPGVLSVALVYHHFDTDLEGECVP